MNKRNLVVLFCTLSLEALSMSTLSAAPVEYVREGSHIIGSNAIGANSTNTRINTVSVGSPGAERQIVNLAPGVDGTDAVNLDQLNSVEHKMAAGIAATMAMSPAIIAPGKTSAVAVGTGYYDGSAAIAVSISHIIREDIYVNGAVSYGSNGGNGTNLGNNSNVGARASVSYSF